MGRLIDTDMLYKEIEKWLGGFKPEKELFQSIVDNTPTVEIADLIDTIEELRDSNGTATQTEVCQFLLAYMKQIGLREERE